MGNTDSNSIDALLSGGRRGAGASLLRGALRCAEPFYAGAVRVRNWMYDRGVFHAHRAAAPVVSVGNITAGGTGKTPVVQWLAARLAREGMHPAILMRGYKRAGCMSDEEDLLRESLSGEAKAVVHAEPDRVAAAEAVVRQHPDVDLIILDDGFQHRRLARDFDMVLIDATSPFGYGHVHPRGLLREPLRGLKRADAFLLTRCDLIPDAQRQRLEQRLRSMSRVAPVYRCRHVLAGLRSAGASLASPADQPISILSTTPFFVFAGIANPAALHQQLSRFGESYRGHRWFGDHHAYSDADLEEMRRAAAEAGGRMVIVTEKDWRKLLRLERVASLPIFRLDLQIQFGPPGEDGLIELIRARLEATRSPT